MFTCHSSSARSLLAAVRRCSHDRILLFALAPSPTTPPHLLSHVTSTLTQLYPNHVGCISAPLLDHPHLCSLAYALVDGATFRSTIPGNPEVHVGRWHAARNPSAPDPKRDWLRSHLADSDGKVDWQHVWKHSPYGPAGSHTLPDGLRNVDPSIINSVFYFSDNAPEGLASVLQSAFPRANKLSLIASSTPFITGRPVTLFYNGSILSSGAVGIAFSSPPYSSKIDISMPPLVALSEDLNVTRSEGNLILSLDASNPTQLLLNAIRKHGLSSHTTWVGKEDEFYVGVIDPSTQQISQLHRIHAGDPSRGGIALDVASAPIEGTAVRLYHLPKDVAQDALSCTPDALVANSISLFVAPEMTSAANHETADGPVEPANDRSIVSNTFLASSENGFVVSRDMQGPWKCVVPSGRARLELSL